MGCPSLLLCASLLCALTTSTPTGPYATKQERIHFIPGLTGCVRATGNCAAVIVYPVGKQGETFPFLVFAHGATAGPALPTAYRTLLKTVASYGFVIVAPKSCQFCDFRHDIMATAAACRAENRSALHPALATATFEKIGVFGHSNGACAAGALAGQASHVENYHIKAVVAQHGGCFPMMPPPRRCVRSTVPIMYVTGSMDVIAPEFASTMGYKQSGDVPKVLFSIAGSTHFEPIDILGPGREDKPVALFLACHVKGEHCDSVYGTSGKAICNQSFKMDECLTNPPSGAQHQDQLLV